MEMFSGPARLGTNYEKRYGIVLRRAGEGCCPAALAHSRHVGGGVGVQGEPVVPATAFSPHALEGLYEMAHGDRIRRWKHGRPIRGSGALPALGIRHAWAYEGEREVVTRLIPLIILGFVAARETYELPETLSW